MPEVTHRTLGQRVSFGHGTAAAALRRETTRLDAHRMFVISGRPAVASRLVGGGDAVVRWTEIVEHVPVDTAARARGAAAESGADCLVAIGGGSAIGLAKAVALTTALPIIAVPTTFAGSEATNVWGTTESNRKTTGVDDRVLPSVVIYDSELVVGLPVKTATASAFNALAHCVDSFWAPHADPVAALLAEEAIRSISGGLRRVTDRPGDIEGLQALQYGAYLAGVAFASAGSGMHHKICHALGGAFDLPHADTHSAVLPYVLAYNLTAASEARRRLTSALGHPDALAAVDELLTLTAAPRSLRECGMRADDIPAAATSILPTIPASNPRRVTLDTLTGLLEAAWAGTPPREVMEP
jgi:alcohol dehydrogenase class IV